MTFKLGDDVRSKLDLLASGWGTTRTAALERVVREYEHSGSGRHVHETSEQASERRRFEHDMIKSKKHSGPPKATPIGKLLKRQEQTLKPPSSRSTITGTAGGPVPKQKWLKKD